VKSKKYPFLKQIILTDADMLPERGTVLFRDVSVYGPFGYYETPLRRIALNLSPDDPVLVLQDRDNINLSKNVVFSHKNLLNMGLLFGKEVNINEGDRVIIPQYQNTSLGCILANFSSFVNGATIILPSQYFSPKTTLNVLSKEKGTHIFATEEDFRKLIDTSNQPDCVELDFSTLKSAIIESPASKEIIQEIEQRFKTKVYKVDNLLESGGALTINNKLISNTEAKIIRHKDGKILYPDTHGYLKIKGPTVSTGVWNDIGFMKDSIDEDGWLDTKKLALISKEGVLDIVN